jgi:diacylglycerol kinase family enzyme
MRICLYWNPSAGDGIPLQHIVDAVTRAGHSVARVLQQQDDAAEALHMGVDLLVAAGGDGTVARAARALAFSNLPLAILPLGTANNIGISLGIESDPLKAIAKWRQQKIVAIDVGVVTSNDGDRIFIEGVGSGLVARGISRGKTDPANHADTAAQVEWAREVFLAALSELRPQHSRLCIDSEEVEGDYLLVEVLNIASVGPRLRLSAETTPADGLLSVVIAGEEDREAIAGHLNQSSNDRDDHAWLKSWRAGRVDVTGWHEYHVDDQVLQSDSGKLTITIRPASLQVLA